MTHCFAKSSIDEIPPGMRVMVNAAPPANDLVTNETYPYWPATDYSSAQAALGSSTYSKLDHKRDYFVFANRRNQGSTAGNPNYKPNDSAGRTIHLDSKECRPCFTTIGNANAATRIQIRHILGLDWQSIAASNPQLEVLLYSDWNTDDLVRRAQIFTQDFVHTNGGGSTTYRVCWDKVLLHPHDPDNLPKITGVELDYECQDGRSEATTASFTNLIRYDVKVLADMKAIFLVNPYNSPGAAKSGLTQANLATIFNDWDHVSIWLHVDNPDGSIPASYATQVGMLPTLNTAAKWKKLMIRFELGQDPTGNDPGTTLEDATWLHNKLTEAGDLHPSFVQFHRNGAPVGGACSTYTNSKIRRVVFGT